MRTQALVIKKQNTNEYDQWIISYTKDFGKLTALAKSILKPNTIQGMHLDMGNLVEFELISGKGMPIISAAQVIDTHRNIKTTPQASAFMYYFLEVMDKVVFDQQEDPILWDFMVSTLEEINSGKYNFSWFRDKQARLINILGYEPQLEQCEICAQDLKGDPAKAMSPEVGGFICANCFLAGYQAILLKQEDLDILSGKGTKDLKPGRSILDMILEQTTNTQLHSLKLIYPSKL